MLTLNAFRLSNVDIKQHSELFNVDVTLQSPNGHVAVRSVSRKREKV